MPVSLIFACLSFLFSFFLVFHVKNLALKLNLLATPNQRSAHRQPVPAIGGIGFILAFYIVIALSWENYFSHDIIFFKILILTLPIAITGLWDDFRSINVFTRLSIQFVIASLAYFWGFKITIIELPFFMLEVNWASYIVSVLFMIASSNLFNFIDGANGYLSGISLIAFSFIGILAFQNSLLSMAFLLLLLVSALVGFLCWNFPVAKIFMGDVGSCFLGFIFSLIAIKVDQSSTLSLTIPCFMFAVLFFDSIITIVVRILKRKNITQAHKEHHYQQLIGCGFSHQKVSIFAYIQTLIYCACLFYYPQLSKVNRLILLFSISLWEISKYSWVYFYSQKHVKK